MRLWQFRCAAVEWRLYSRIATELELPSSIDLEDIWMATHGDIHGPCKQPGPWSICADHGAASNQTSSAQGVSQDFANCAGQDAGSARHCGHIRSLVLYVPTNLLDAIRFSKGFTIVEEEFVMEGVAILAGAPHTPGRYLQHLPKSLQSLTFDDSCDQNLEGVNLPHCLQSLTFDRWLNQLLAEMKLPNSLQSLAFGVLFNHSREAVN